MINMHALSVCTVYKVNDHYVSRTLTKIRKLDVHDCARITFDYFKRQNTRFYRISVGI